MEITTSYKARILHPGRRFRETIRVFRKALAFVISVVDAEWEVIGELPELRRKNAVEHLIHGTSSHEAKYGFDQRFPKMPSYLRRAVIAQAIGMVSSRKSRFLDSDDRPERIAMPVFYDYNMSRCADMLAGESDSVRLKLFDGSEWRWEDVDLRHQDAKYLAKHWQGHKASAPILCRDGEGLALRFMITRKADLPEQRPLRDRKALAVALGSHVDACCCVMMADGSILARKFINFGADFEAERRLMNRMRGLKEKHGETGGRKEWRLAMNAARNHAIKVAGAVVAYAGEQGADVIVFKHFYYRPRKKGTVRTDIWRKNAVQDLVEPEAHLHGMRVSKVCAQGVSSLAFDGSGEVIRGTGSDAGNCVFRNGKSYNYKLNASYNIGARYFLREMAKADLDLDLPKPARRTLKILQEIHNLEVRSSGVSSRRSPGITSAPLAAQAWG